MKRRYDRPKTWEVRMLGDTKMLAGSNDGPGPDDQLDPEFPE